MTQGSAIIRYAGKQTKLYPADDFQAAKVDEAINLLEEMQTKMGPSMREKDEAKKMELRKVLAEEELPKFFSNLEKLLEANGTTYFVGDSITVADLCIWKGLHWITSGVIDGIPTTVADKYTKLMSNYKAVDTHAKVVEWKAKYPQFYKK